MSGTGGPDLPPRPPGGRSAFVNKPPSPGAAPKQSSGPPLPAPRQGSVVSALAKSFQANGPPTPGSAPPSRNINGPPVPAARTSVSAAPPVSPVSNDPPPTPPPSLPSRRLISENSKPPTVDAVTTPPPGVPTSTSRPSVPTTTKRPSKPVVESVVRHDSTAMATNTEGFGICLQNCYDTINKRHEDELLALESLRNHLFARSRLDREYAENMAKMNTKASRKMGSVSNKSSAIMQVCLAAMLCGGGGVFFEAVWFPRCRVLK